MTHAKCPAYSQYSINAAAILLGLICTILSSCGSEEAAHRVANEASPAGLPFAVSFQVGIFFSLMKSLQK